jgi:predicted AlkP superfamily phosphohydrolase/phosphomutase
VRVAVIGLDSESPALWERFDAVLPTIGRMRREGIFLPLASTDPPITVPAWMSMLSGRDPGELGVYGFRNRASYGYGALVTADATHVRVPRVWDVLGAHGLKSAVVGVPGTYPPPPVAGVVVSDFLTPPGAPYTSPPEFRETVERVVGGPYRFDVEGFRSHDLPRIRDEALAMTERRFDLACHLAEGGEWDFLMVHEIGLDRVHHAFWNHFDPQSPRHVPDSPFASVVERYHRYLDARIADLLARLPDECVVFVVSDHGSRAMEGGVYLNDWLRQEGLLTLRREVEPGTPLRPELVDWSRTRAWAEGGYYGRVFLNVSGREPEGTVAPAEARALAERIARGLEELRCGAEVLVPQETYRAVRPIAPDLMVYLGGLGWRALGSVGHDDLYAVENDTGPDGANHDRLGVFLAWGKGVGLGARCSGTASILDVAPTLLEPFGLAEKLPGEPIVEVTDLA